MPRCWDPPWCLFNMIRKKGAKERRILLFISIPQAAKSKLQLPLRKNRGTSSKLLTHRSGCGYLTSTSAHLWSAQSPWEYRVSPHRQKGAIPPISEDLQLPSHGHTQSKAKFRVPCWGQWTGPGRGWNLSAVHKVLQENSGYSILLLGSEFQSYLARHCVPSSPGSLLRTKPLDLPLLTSSSSFRKLLMVTRSVSLSWLYPKFCFQSC